MPDDAQLDKALVASWRKNASSWTDAVRRGRISSRGEGTDDAIVATVMSRHPKSVLDVGCGEGWLSHTIASRGLHVTGIDAVPELVTAARERGPGEFHVVAYEDLDGFALDTMFDVIVCNYSLLGEASTHAVVAASGRLLAPGGALIVQTLHPMYGAGDVRYRDGWREESWKGFGDGFKEASPWYVRTLGSWIRLLTSQGLRLVDLREPVGVRADERDPTHPSRRSSW